MPTPWLCSTSRSLCCSWLSLAVGLAACSRDVAPLPPLTPPTAPRALKKPRAEIAILATGDEGAGVARADQVLAQWKTKEAHCLDGACNTIALSTGGHPGPASSVLSRLGYAASVYGAKEREALADGIPLAAGPPHLGADDAHVSTVVERGGIKFFILGVRRSTQADGGTDVAAAEALMRREIPGSWQVAPATLVVSDLCVADLATILETNARAWPFLLVVVGKPCGPLPEPRHIYSVLLLAAPEGFESYGKATLSLDQHTAALLKAEGQTVALPR